MAVIYFFAFACTAKFGVPEWANGTAIYYWLARPTFGLPDPLRAIAMPVLANAWGVTLVTWSVLALEASLFMGLAMRDKYRPYLLGLGLAFHFGIVVGHGLFTFFLAMAAALVLYLRPVEQPFRRPVWWGRRAAAPVAPLTSARGGVLEAA